MNIEQILSTSGALVTAVVIAVNALKAMGLPGKVMPFVSILLGMGGAYLTISHDPAVWVIVGVLVTGTEHGIFALNQNYFAKKEIEHGIVPPPATLPDADEMPEATQPPTRNDFPPVLNSDKLEPEPEE